MENIDGIVATVLKRYYPHLINDIEDVVQQVWASGWNEQLPQVDKLRMISRAAYQVSTELGFRHQSLKRQRKTGTGSWVRGSTYDDTYMQPTRVYQEPEEPEETNQIDTSHITADNWQDYLGKVPDQVIAKIRGISTSAVAQWRRKRDIPTWQRSFSDTEQKFIFDNRGKMSYAKIGQILGRNKESVRAFLRRRGMPTFAEWLLDKTNG